MLLKTFFLLTVLATAVNGVNYSCPSQQVLAFAKQDSQEIDLSPVPVTVCGEQRTCVYHEGGPCTAKGSYLAGVMESNGVIKHGCCQISSPVQDHQGDECHPLHIETTDGVRVSSPHPPPLAKYRQGGGGGGGQGSNPPKEEVVMEVKQTPPGLPNQYIKSIAKMSGSTQGYTVQVCTPQCGRSTTTKQPTTQKTHSHEKDQKSQQQPQPQQPPPAAHPKKGLFGGHHCFSGDMTVTTPFGTKRMDEVRAGDQVLVMSSESKPVFEPVEWLYHRDHNAEVDFITVTTKSQRTLRLSANHLIPFVPCSNDELKSYGVDHFANSQSFFARRLRVGQCVATLINNEFVADQVVSVRQERKRGIYSPITNQGTIVVNDMYVSCYSSVENHLAQKTVHSTLIKARQLVSGLWSSAFGASLDKEDSNVPMPLQVILKMAYLVVPSNVFSAY